MKSYQVKWIDCSGNYKIAVITPRVLDHIIPDTEELDINIKTIISIELIPEGV